MSLLRYLNHDPQDNGPQYLEDIATGYWFSQVLFAAVEIEIFTLIDANKRTLQELAEELGFDSKALGRFLQALIALGLVTVSNNYYYNTKISSQYLVAAKEDYQGDSILWRKYLTTNWRDLKDSLKIGGRIHFSANDEDQIALVTRIRKYIKAMDNVATTKVKEFLPFFETTKLNGCLLDVGAGSGAITAGFLKKFPHLSATLIDLPDVLNYTQELLNERGLGDRVVYQKTNILDNWPIKKECYDLVILSNIVHAYSEDEILHILDQAISCLKPEGYLLIHDFFLEHYPSKASLLDLNMFINTYNGKVFSQHWVKNQLTTKKLYSTDVIPLPSDTAVIIGSKTKKNLSTLVLNSEAILISRIIALGFSNAYSISVDKIQLAEWTQKRCQFGCERYGKAHCPPNSPSPSKTREVLKDYSKAILLEGEPPTRDFQQKVLLVEREAFKLGYVKAFAYWAGPCSICKDCNLEGPCLNPKDARPSMEGAGIDVFTTVKEMGISLRTLENKDDWVKYFALIILE